jgi:hypothetical protein
VAKKRIGDDGMKNAKDMYIHRVDTYDYDERVSAMWDGYIVQFKKSEYDRLMETKMEGLEVINEKDVFGFGRCVHVQLKKTKSDWEDLFQ